MCDCYGHPCKICGKIIPTHIMDFITPQDNIEAFCGRHIPKTGRVFVYMVTKGEEGFRKGAKIGFIVIDGRRVRWRWHRGMHNRFANKYETWPYHKPELCNVVTPNMWAVEEITEV